MKRLNRGTIKNYSSKYYKNLKMNKGVYKLRKEIIGIVYKLKSVVDFPRINVRITENPIDKNILGSAQLNSLIIWIPIDTIIHCDYEEKYWVVAHELIHTIKGIDHNPLCNLMNPTYKKISINEINKIFKSYF